MALILCLPSDDALCLIQFYTKISSTVRSFRTDTVFLLNITNQNNSEKNGGVMVLVLSTLSDKALYLYQVS